MDVEDIGTGNEALASRRIEHVTDGSTSGEIGDLVAAISAVCEEIEVEKTGYNKFHKFRFPSIQDLAEGVRPMLAKHGLAIFPVAWDEDVFDHGVTERGKLRLRYEVVVSYRVAHKSGQSIVLPLRGSAIDDEDKGPYKAYSGAWKYLVRQLFSVAGADEDPDTDSPVERGKGTKATPRRREPPPVDVPEPWTGEQKVEGLGGKAAKHNGKPWRKVDQRLLDWLIEKGHRLSPLAAAEDKRRREVDEG